MLYLIAGVLLLGLVVGIVYLLSKQQTDGHDEVESHVVVPSDCCGEHAVCERDSLLTAVSKDIEYYDDEELDLYRGRESDEYDEEAVEEFREVLYTMREVETAGWLRSLQLRNINLPDQLKDEVFLIVGERRSNQRLDANNYL